MPSWPSAFFAERLFACFFGCLLGRRLLCCFFNCQRFTSFLGFWRSSWPAAFLATAFPPLAPVRFLGGGLRGGFLGRRFFGRCFLGLRAFFGAAFLAGAFFAALASGSFGNQRRTSLRVRPRRHRKRSIRWRFLLLRPHRPRLRRDSRRFRGLIVLIAITHRVHLEQLHPSIASSGWRCVFIVGAADDAPPHAEAIVAIACSNAHENTSM